MPPSEALKQVEFFLRGSSQTFDSDAREKRSFLKLFLFSFSTVLIVLDNKRPPEMEVYHRDCRNIIDQWNYLDIGNMIDEIN